MPALSARQIGTAALLMIGAASAEQPISAFMAENTRDALNSMLDSWSTEKLLVYSRPKIPLVLVPGRASYTWGIATPACDIPREPPVSLELALLTVDDTVPGLEWELAILDQYAYEARIWIKQLSSSQPTAVYMETTQPVATLHAWPVPDLPYTLQLLPWMAHSPYGGWDDVLDWPSGYQRPMTYNLAVDIAPQYGVEPSPTILRIADESKRALYPINAEVGRLRLNPRRSVSTGGLGLPQDFLTGRG